MYILFSIPNSQNYKLKYCCNLDLISSKTTLKIEFATPGLGVGFLTRCKTEFEQLVDFVMSKPKDSRKNRIIATVPVRNLT